MTPSPTRFVARLPDSASSRTAFAKLAPFAQYEAISGHPHLWLISLKGPAGDARTAWKKLRAAVGTKVTIAPALIDEEGNVRLPTGTVIARFATNPTDEELAAFGNEFGLDVVERNKFVPKQVSFRPARKDSFLPELVDQVSRAKANQIKVWADTLSQFRRA
jgi:hypothetical protein